MINWQPGNLEDKLVKLLPLSLTDFDRLFEAASDPLIWEQHPAKDRYKKEVFQEYFDNAIAEKMAFLIIDKASGKTIGSTRYYDFQPGHSSIAIGYTFHTKEYWGGKYNSACKKLLLDYAFQYVERVYLHIGANNLRSQVATTRIGGKKTREFIVTHYGRDDLHFEYVIEKQDHLLKR
jgi:RimJ/RimL family protein N-acetyltransferase